MAESWTPAEERAAKIAEVLAVDEPPEATAEDFIMNYDAEHVFPFIEDEDGNIAGYGHQDRDEFAERVNGYDRLCGAVTEDSDPGDLMDASLVKHQWAVFSADREYFQLAREHDPGAFPITTIWGVR